MFNFFKNTKKYQDLTPTLAEIADFLIDDTASDLATPLKEYLDPKKLDYSLESLKHVDAYLDKVRNVQKTLSEDQFIKVVLRCGAYCGEVIRKLSVKNLYWIDYDTAVTANPKLKSFEKSLDTFYILFAEPDNLFFPLAKVGKYLDNGPEDGLYFLAVALLSPTSNQKIGQEGIF